MVTKTRGYFKLLSTTAKVVIETAEKMEINRTAEKPVAPLASKELSRC